MFFLSIKNDENYCNIDSLQTYNNYIFALYYSNAVDQEAAFISTMTVCRLYTYMMCTGMALSVYVYIYDVMTVCVLRLS